MSDLIFPMLKSSLAKTLSRSSSKHRWSAATVYLTITEGQSGVSGIGAINLGGAAGYSRVQNSVAGYVAWVGLGSLPDLTQAPTVYSATLPFSIAVTPPISGTLVVYVIVAKRDSYGLVSQNQYPTIFTIDSAGGILKNALNPPQGLLVVQQAGGYIRSIATYAGFGVDAFPATQWMIWVKTTLPVPGVDVPAYAGAVNQTLAKSVGVYTPNTYYVMVGLYRASDGTYATVYTTVAITSAPAELDAVPSGFQGA